MVQSSTLAAHEIDAMMKRIHAVPIIETLQMEILRLDKRRICPKGKEVGWNLRDFPRRFTSNNRRHYYLLGNFN